MGEGKGGSYRGAVEGGHIPDLPHTPENGAVYVHDTVVTSFVSTEAWRSVAEGYAGRRPLQG